MKFRKAGAFVGRTVCATFRYLHAIKQLLLRLFAVECAKHLFKLGGNLRVVCVIRHLYTAGFIPRGVGWALCRRLQVDTQVMEGYVVRLAERFACGFCAECGGNGYAPSTYKPRNVLWMFAEVVPNQLRSDNHE